MSVENSALTTWTDRIPVAAVATLGCLSLACGFNGLYGQDAHLYLQWSKVYFTWMQGGAYPYIGSELAGGYPMAAALLRFLIGDPILSLQLVSWISAGVALALFDALLQQLHGPASGRHWYTVLLLGMAPFFVRAGSTVMSDALGLALVLATLLYGLRTLEYSRGRHLLAAVFWGVLAVHTRHSAMALLLPLALALVWVMAMRGRWLMLLGGLMAGTVGLLPLFLVQGHSEGGLLQHSLFLDGSWLNPFRRSFNTLNGTLHYGLPNGLYALLYPLLYPGFCLLLPAVLLLFAKKSDLRQRDQRIILACLLAQLLLLMLVAGQNPRHLLPGYALLLLLLFPAAGRLSDYGMYSYKKWLYPLTVLALLVQLTFSAYYLYPVVQRFRLEKSVAAVVQKVVPPHATIYGFDLDISLKSYLPEVRVLNLWDQRYAVFQPGSYVLFNEPRLRAQWEGKNPMLNWETLQKNHRLEVVQNMGDGWILYRF